MTPEAQKFHVEFDALMEMLIQSPRLHARWLNTLSLLEYIGARKILKSQPAQTMTFEVLSHVSEEIRHSQAIKRLALKMSGGELVSYKEDYLLAGSAARAFFQTLDWGASEDISHSKLEHQKSTWLNYLYTTLLIEERAGEIYPRYAKVLKKCGHTGVMETILKEETQHLSDVYRHLEQADPKEMEERLARLRALEHAVFYEFIRQATQVCREDQQMGHRPEITLH